MISTSVPTTTGNLTVVSMSATSGNPVHLSEENVDIVRFIQFELMIKKQNMRILIFPKLERKTISLRCRGSKKV